MSRLSHRDRDELPEETQEALRVMEEEQMEYLPESLLIMAHRPKVVEGFVKIREAIFEGDVENELKLMLAFVSSHTRGCDFCQSHTGCNLYYRSDTTNDKIRSALNFEEDDRFSDRERAALRLARDASKIPNEVGDEHFEELKKHFTESEIVEVVLPVCLFGFLNCFNDTMGTTLEPMPREWATEELLDMGWEIGQHQ